MQQIKKTGVTKLFGIPGSGKSTHQSKEIKESIQLGGLEGNLITSFSKGAVGELVKRNLKEGTRLSKKEKKHFGTLHSICFHMLGSPVLVETKEHIDEFNTMYPDFALSSTTIDEDTLNTSAHTRGDLLMNKYMWYRSELKPFNKWETEIQDFHKAWETFKGARFDFLGLIEEVLKRDLYPAPKVKVMFVDEAQDLVPVEFQVIKKWYEKIPDGVISGDDDQCHLPGTQVLVIDEEKSKLRKTMQKAYGYMRLMKVEDLFEEERTKMLVSYNFESGELFPNYYEIQKMFFNKTIVKANDQEWTFNHRVYVSWGEIKETHCLCLAMTALGSLTAFTTELFKDKEFLPVKISQENKFRYLWILELGEKDEMLKEFPDEINTKTITEKYQVYLEYPFWSNSYIGKYDYDYPDGIFCVPAYYFLKLSLCLTGVDLTERRYPSTSYFQTDNVVPKITKIPVTEVSSRKEESFVYSFYVERDHNYIVCDEKKEVGILNHNCIYHFKGANPNLLLEYETDKIQILDHSYRVPHNILDYSMKWIKQVKRRQEKPNYKGNEKEGIINFSHLNFKNTTPLLKEIVKDIEKNKEVMVLSSCSYMLDPLKHLLKQEGIPFHNPFRLTRHDWNPLRFDKKRTPLNKRLFDFLSVLDDDEDLGELDASGFEDPFEDLFEEETPFSNLCGGEEKVRDAGDLFSDETLMIGKYWFGHQFKNWAFYTSGLWKRGGKKTAQETVDRAKIYEGMLKNLFKNENDVLKAINNDIEWFKSVLKKDSFNEYPFKILERYGKTKLIERPKLIIGTIYSMKGAEADSVYVIPDLSNKGFKNFSLFPDPIIRLYYVAFTRAKEKLTLLSPQSFKSVRWIKN